MERKLIGGVLLLGLLLVFGCNPKVGIISLNTNPQGATVYLNGVPTGETPTKFEFDMEKPVTMKLVKEGYKPVEEKLTVNWVKSEYHQGNYHKGEYMIKGTTQNGFEVNATRELIKAD
jgi:hypothetical protein